MECYDQVVDLKNRIKELDCDVASSTRLCQELRIAAKALEKENLQLKVSQRFRDGGNNPKNMILRENITNDTIRDLPTVQPVRIRTSWSTATRTRRVTAKRRDLAL